MINTFNPVVHARYLSRLGMLSAILLTGCVGLGGPSHAGGPHYFSGWFPWRIAMTGPAEAQSPAPESFTATFIVRFSDEPEVDQMCRNFRRDETGTRNAFRNWAEPYAALKGLYLVRASYSGELILGLPENDPAGRSPDQVLSELSELDNLAYAEIDQMATTSKGR